MKSITITTIDELNALDLKHFDVTENISIQIRLRLEDQELDYPISIIHSKPGLESQVQVKLALFGKSKVTMPVEIRVNPGAIETATNFKALALVMSSRAQANITPGMYIHEKDILSAGHGVVIKNIKETDLVYLRARGMQKETAREMLVQL